MHRIDLTQIANVGNRMIQYAVAERLQRLIQPCELVNIRLPEWGLVSDPAPERDFDTTITVTDDDMRSIPSVVAEVRRHHAVRILMRGFFQDLDVLPSHDHASRLLFPTSNKYKGRFDRSQIIINVRAGDILRGIAWYPTVPVEFYLDLVEKTGLSPVFVGQVGPSGYVDRMRAAFPEAEFIATGNPMDDFELVRSGHNICIAVSTFSWLAAWLSDARQIFYPMLGFLHPGLTDCYVQKIASTNLVPAQDPRYRFFLFPLFYGLNEESMAEIHRRASACCKEISASQAKAISERKFLLPVEKMPTKFDSVWYAHRYPDAAMEVAEGLYSTPHHHFSGIGSVRGLQPSPPLVQPTCPNVSKGRRANQSSISPWSHHQDREADAAGAVDGDPGKEYGFHTSIENKPWWMIDLGESCNIECITIYNRRAAVDVRERAFPLLVESSLNGSDYVPLYLFEADTEFGLGKDTRSPFQVHTPALPKARFIRITAIRGRTALHLAQVEVFGSRTRP